jgi:hypothetical protein
MNAVSAAVCLGAAPRAAVVVLGWPGAPGWTTRGGLCAGCGPGTAGAEVAAPPPHAAATNTMADNNPINFISL